MPTPATRYKSVSSCNERCPVACLRGRDERDSTLRIEPNYRCRYKQRFTASRGALKIDSLSLSRNKQDGIRILSRGEKSAGSSGTKEMCRKEQETKTMINSSCNDGERCCENQDLPPSIPPGMDLPNNLTWNVVNTCEKLKDPGTLSCLSVPLSVRKCCELAFWCLTENSLGPGFEKGRADTRKFWKGPGRGRNIFARAGPGRDFSARLRTLAQAGRKLSTKNQL